jgi:hypothetical protein
MNTKNKKIGFVVVGIIVLVGVFYGGMTYGGNNVKAALSSRGPGASGFAGRTGGTRSAGGFIGGQIIAKDATSITVQLMAGGPAGTGNGATTTSQAGSKIIFLDNNTKVTKQADGTLADLAVGTSVSVTGTPNTDGSINAQTVQIRPSAPAVVK